MPAPIPDQVSRLAKERYEMGVPVKAIYEELFEKHLNKQPGFERVFEDPSGIYKRAKPRGLAA